MPSDNNSLTRKNIYFSNARMVYVLSVIVAAHNISQIERMIFSLVGVQYYIIISTIDG